MKKLNSKIKTFLGLASLTLLMTPIITLSAVACFPRNSNFVIEINTQPQNKSVVIGQKENLPVFSVGVNNNVDTKLFYQWYFNTTKSNMTGTIIDGATNPSYTITTDDLKSAGTLKYFYVKVSGEINGISLTPVFSDPASLTIKTIPEIVINSQPVSETVYTNQNADFPSFSVVVTPIDNAQLTYQWYSNAINSTENATAIEGATNATYTTSKSDIGTPESKKYFYVQVSGSVGGIKLSHVNSKLVSLTTKALPTIVINTQPQNQTISENQTTNLPLFSVTINKIEGAQLTYQWYSNTTNSNKGGTPINGANNPSYQVKNVDIALTPKYFYVRVGGTISGAELEPVYSEVASLIKIANLKITQQAVNPQTQFIYKHETPVLFALVPARTGTQSVLRMSGTAWVFDAANYTNSDPLLRTYYLATNHHVIDFTKSVLNSIETTKQNIKDGKQRLGANSFPYGTDASNLKFFVKMMLPKYQFGANPKQALSQESVNSSANYYNFSTGNKDLLFSSNYLFYSGQTKQYTSSNDSIFQNLPTRNFDFTVNNLTWTDVIDRLNLKSRVGDGDVGFIQLSFNKDATEDDIPNIIKNFNNYYLTLNKYINPFAANPILLNKKYYIGGFPGIEGGLGLKWVSPSSTITAENPNGNINLNSPNPSVFPILNEKGTTVNAFAYNQNQGYLGAYTYIFPGLNLNHGSSGSMVTNAEHQIIGIYWGGIKTTNLANHQSSFKGAVISFSENKIIPIWNQYYKQFLAPITQGTPTNFLSYFITKTNS